MVADRSSRLREVFDLALDRPASERSSFVDGLCSDDAALRAEVLSLLVAFDEADSFLEAPRKAGAGAAAGDDPAMGLIGKRIGHYRIEQLIAAGGMGVVYEAIQDQPRRTAAVKVIRSGIASRAALRRFAHEAEILGRLRHPGIAQVYEAGTHDTAMGRVPFFAMEYVPEPRTLVEYAETQNLSVRDRLRLFADVCDAVQHAHQHGVIHRDLK
ncbi:MAG: protein kinase, partial [Candidatus Brocadiae bacterium]|nr:protein kinase [Candidatus Brocadiia bacterium]